MNTQTKLSFILAMLTVSAMTVILGISNLAYAGPNAKTKKSTEDYFAESYHCLKINDKTCAQIAAANIPSQSPYSKLLNGIFASLEGDFDTTFRELLPLQSNKSLNSQASVSLHTSLALAYENQSDNLRALEQRVMAESAMLQIQPSNQDDINTNQHQIWEILSVLSKTSLTEIRGNSANTIIQGWIDLALAAKYQADGENNQQMIDRWRSAYPDHPAKDGLATQLFPIAAAKSDMRKAKLRGTVALLLPFSNSDYYPIADAIERGFTIAKKIAKDNADIKIYPSQASLELTLKLYQQALNEGAKYIVGPLSDDEAKAINHETGPATTLMLNKTRIKPNDPNQYSYGLSATDEVQQIIKIAKNLGMQKATVISSNSDADDQIALNFKNQWLASGGQLEIINMNDDIKKQVSEIASDMIFITAEAEKARLIRAALPTNTPTFGTSKIYSGIAFNADDLPLKGVRFVDLPWMIDRNNPDFSAYKQAAADLPAGEMQRWFALGADAYQILLALDRRPSAAISIDGLSGKIEINPLGEISRSLANASFGAEGIILETLQ